MMRTRMHVWPGQGHLIGYDLNGNRTSDTSIGNRITAGSGNSVVAGYVVNGTGQTLVDESGNPILNVSVDGQGRTYYGVDESGNPVYVTAQAGTAPTTYSATVGRTTEQYAYDALGRISRIYRDGTLVDSREYDGASRLVQSGPAGTLSKAYTDLLGSSSANGIQTTINRFDDDGRLLVQRVLHADGSAQYTTTYDNYDAVGNLLQYHVDQGGTTATYSTDLVKYDGYKEETVSGTSTTLQPGSTTDRYDVNGNLVGVTGSPQGANDRTLVNDVNGHVLYRNQAGNQEYFVFANGQQVGATGMGLDTQAAAAGNGAPRFTEIEDFNLGYRPISPNYPAASIGSYRVAAGDTLQSIAQAAYGDASLWYTLAEANGLRGNADLKVGQTLNIPNKVYGTHNDAGTFAPYDPSRAVGSTTPSLAAPHSGGGCGGFGGIAMLVVAVAATVVTAGAAAIAMGAVEGTTLATASLTTIVSAGGSALVGGTAVTGATIAGVSIGTEIGVGTAMAASAVGAAVGSIASQAVGNALGAVDGFSWNQVARSALSAGVSAGVGGEAVSLYGAGAQSTSALMARAAVSNAVTQGIGVVTGLQPGFSWTSVAASAVGAGAGSAAAQGMNGALDYDPGPGYDFGRSLGSGFVSGMAAGATTAVFSGGRVSVQQVATDAFGNALGNSLAEMNWGGSQQTAELKTAWAAQSSGSSGAGAGMGASGAGEIDSHALEMARLDGHATAELALHGALDQVPARAISMGEVGPSLIDASLYEIGEEPGKNGRNGLIWNTGTVSYGVDLSYPQMRQLSANELGPVIVGGALQWPVGSEGWKRQQESAQALQQPMFAPDDLIGAPIKLGEKGIVAGAGALFGTMKNVGSKEIGVLLRQGSEITPRSVVADEVAALRRIGANSSVGSGSIERLARISELSEANAARQLDRLQSEARAINPNAHFFDRHGFNTTLEQQYIRAGTGLTPDGVQQNFLVDSSRFLTARDQVAAIQRAESINLLTGQSVVNVNMGSIVGEGFTALRPNGIGLDYLLTTNVRTVFKNGAVYTQFPSLRP